MPDLVAPKYACQICGRQDHGVIIETKTVADVTRVTRWTVPLNWRLDVPPAPPLNGARATCFACKSG